MGQMQSQKERSKENPFPRDRNRDLLSSPTGARISCGAPQKQTPEDRTGTAAFDITWTLIRRGRVGAVSRRPGQPYLQEPLSNFDAPGVDRPEAGPESEVFPLCAPAFRSLERLPKITQKLPSDLCPRTCTGKPSLWPYKQTNDAFQFTNLGSRARAWRSGRSRNFIVPANVTRLGEGCRTTRPYNGRLYDAAQASRV